MEFEAIEPKKETSIPNTKLFKLPVILDGKYFQPFDIVNENVKAKCILCKENNINKELSGSIKSTSNFRKHLQRVHPSIFDDFEEYIKAKIKLKRAKLRWNESEQFEEYTVYDEISHDDSTATDYCVPAITEEEPKASASNTCSNLKPPPPLKKMPKVEQLNQKINGNILLQKSHPSTIKRKDDCELYSELVATKLKKMDERTRDVAMNRIDNLLFEMKMNSYQHSPFYSQYHYEHSTSQPDIRITNRASDHPNQHISSPSPNSSPSSIIQDE